MNESLNFSQEFDALPEPLRAAWCWIDGMAVAGGRSPWHPSSLDGLGWTWEEFGEALKTYRKGTSHDRLDEAVELMEEWMEEAAQDTDALDLAKSHVSWCFADQDIENGVVFFYMWPSAAPGLEFEGLTLPTPEHAFESQEGLWEIDTGESDPGQSRREVWNIMAQEGFVFDATIQQNSQGTSYAYFNSLEADPEGFWSTIQSQIPALASAKEAKELDEAAGNAFKKSKNAGL